MKKKFIFSFFSVFALIALTLISFAKVVEIPEAVAGILIGSGAVGGDVTAPELVEDTDTKIDTDGTSVYLKFSENMNVADQDDDEWNLDCDGASGADVALTYVSGTGTPTIRFTTGAVEIQSTETCNADYSNAQADEFQDDSGNDLGSPISDAAVTNNSEQGGATYPDIIHFWTAENNISPFWHANDCSDYDTTPDYHSDAVPSAVQAAVGTYSGYASTTYDRLLFDGLTIDTGSVRVGFYAYINSFGDNEDLFEFSGTTDMVVWLNDKGASGQELELYFGSSVIQTTDCDIPTGEWIFIEIALDDTTPYRRIYVDGVQCGENTGAWDGFTSTSTFLGTDDSDSIEVYFDQFMVSTDPTRDLNALKNETSAPSGACPGP